MSDGQGGSEAGWRSGVTVIMLAWTRKARVVMSDLWQLTGSEVRELINYYKKMKKMMKTLGSEKKLERLMRRMGMSGDMPGM